MHVRTKTKNYVSFKSTLHPLSHLPHVLTLVDTDMHLQFNLSVIVSFFTDSSVSFSLLD